jgi:hypothetical protein
MPQSNAPVNQFEVTESIRFFASLSGTQGISVAVQDKTNEYLLKLLNSMEPSVDQTCESVKKQFSKIQEVDGQEKLIFG